MNAAAVLTKTLRGCRLPAASESALQEAIAAQLLAIGATAWSEFRLGPADRIDFLVESLLGGIGIEAKCRCSKRAIWRQLERYAKHDRIAALILVTGTAIGLPPAINGKPLYYVSLGRAAL